MPSDFYYLGLNRLSHFQIVGKQDNRNETKSSFKKQTEYFTGENDKAIQHGLLILIFQNL